MEKVTPPKTKILGTGNELMAKQMQANAGDLLPKHLASTESVLVIQKGSCTLHFEETASTLTQGDVFIVPAELIHQIEAKQDFRAVHVMPKEIKFIFFK